MTPAKTVTAPERYVLDKTGSRFTVRTFKGGALALLGHSPTIAIPDFTGEARFDPADPAKNWLRIEIRADSLEVTDDIKPGDRREIESTMQREVLEVSKFPVIVFESVEASARRVAERRYQIEMKGKLSLRGVTRSLPVNAQVVQAGNTLRASGEFSMLQSDFGIHPVTVAGGALKIKDELKFAFDILARKQE